MPLKIIKGNNYCSIVIDSKNISNEITAKLNLNLDNLIKNTNKNIIIDLKSCLNISGIDSTDVFVKHYYGCRSLNGSPIVISPNKSITDFILKNSGDAEILITKTYKEAFDLIIIEEIENEISVS
ncbi:MAG: hypothetical protein Q8880_05965 [Bacteroidota bacterium]|nr:hypothetical protein [Bacteroidota bacterium]